jgi:hypothetical protein
VASVVVLHAAARAAGLSEFDDLELVGFLLTPGRPPMPTVTRSTSTPHPVVIAPEIRAVSFSTATIRSGRVVVAKIDCSGIRPQDVRCESTRPGFVVEVLPNRTRQGRFVILAVRIHRELGTPRSLCLLRFSAGSSGAMASLTVLA